MTAVDIEVTTSNQSPVTWQLPGLTDFYSAGLTFIITQLFMKLPDVFSHQPEHSSETVSLFMASGIFRIVPVKTMEWSGAMRLVVS